MRIILQDTSMYRALGIHRRRSLWVSDPAKNSLLFQNGCHCHYPYHLLQHIIKFGQFRASWSQLFGLSVMLEHPFCVFSHPGYQHYCISDTYTLHLILKALLITSDLPERQLTLKVAWLVPVRDGSGETELSVFSPRKTSQVEGGSYRWRWTNEYADNYGGGWEGGGEEKGWEKGNLIYRKYLPWKLIALIGLSSLVCAWLASIWAALGKSLSHSECPLLFLLLPLMSFMFSFFSLFVC